MGTEDEGRVRATACVFVMYVVFDLVFTYSQKRSKG